jgi:hypothetical protein
MFAQDHPAQTPLEPAAARGCLAETPLEKAAPLTKRIALRDGNGSACLMTTGFAWRVRIESMQALAGLINNLALNQVCALGRGGGP